MDEDHSSEAIEVDAPRHRWLRWILILGSYIALGFVIASKGPDFLSSSVGWVLIGSVVALVSGAALIFDALFSPELARIGRIETSAAVLQKEIEQDFFNNLVKINFKYIDKYYLQTQIQADKAFLMSAIAGFFGLAIIAAGIVQMYRGELQPAYVTTAAGVISEFIAAVFFYLYNKTVLRMADYHRKLVLTQNIGLALRIAQDMPEPQRLEAQMRLVDRLSLDINPLLGGSERDD